MREHCRNLVYLKVWDSEDTTIFDEDQANLALSATGRIYAGQTVDFRSRDRRRQDYVTRMGIAGANICFKHRLDNQYHRDAFEVALIAFNFITFGLSQINRSPYGRNWYQAISPEVHVDDISPRHYTCHSGWTTWRYSNTNDLLDAICNYLPIIRSQLGTWSVTAMK